MLFDTSALEELERLRINARKKYYEKYLGIIEKYSKPQENNNSTSVLVLGLTQDGITFELAESEPHDILSGQASCNDTKADSEYSRKLGCSSIYVTPRQNYLQYLRKKFSRKKIYKRKPESLKTPYLQSKINKTKLRYLKTPHLISSCGILNKKLGYVKKNVRHFHCKTCTPSRIAKTCRALNFSKDLGSNYCKPRSQTQCEIKTDFIEDKNHHLNSSSPKKAEETPFNLTRIKNTPVKLATCCDINTAKEKVNELFEDDKQYCEMDVCDLISLYSESSASSSYPKLMRCSTPNHHPVNAKRDQSNSHLNSDSKVYPQAIPQELLEEDKELRVTNWCKTLQHIFTNSDSCSDYKDECPDNTKSPLNEELHCSQNMPVKAYFMEDDEVVLLSLEDSFEKLTCAVANEQDTTHNLRSAEVGSLSAWTSESLSSNSACGVLLHYNS